MEIYIWRIAGAIALAWIGAALVGAITIALAFPFFDPTLKISVVFLPFIVGALFLWGLVYAAVPALLLGLCWELPFAFLGRNRVSRPLPIHIVLSAIAGGVILIFIDAALNYLQPVGRNEGMPLIAIIGASGGICSAITWSRLVHPLLGGKSTT